jgi:glutamyl-Q tRNA(Asp) synthetase
LAAIAEPVLRRASYRGRFAPSPTGPLHFGSLVAALGSYADARARGGEWLVRIEDLDRQRESRGSADSILRTLTALGFRWDGPVLYQSMRRSVYAEALDRLILRRRAYPCGCSRRDIALAGWTGPEGPVYPGTCRGGLAQGREARSIRMFTEAPEIRFTDGVQGEQSQHVESAVGDFVLRRADGIHAYQLAVVIDDAAQGMTDIVRGADLLLSTPRQILLQAQLELPHPRYAHLPLAVDANGRKLSKSLGSLPVDPTNPLPALLQAWRFLGQEAPGSAATDVASFWRWAGRHWARRRIPKRAEQSIA